MTPAHEIDISWTVLRRICKQWAGDSAELSEVRPLVGGCVNTTLLLALKDGQKAVLKICAHRVTSAFAHEAFQLEVLRKIGLPTPQVYTWKIGSLDDPFSYLLMEHLDGIDLHQARKAAAPEEFDHLQCHLADLVLMMHDQTGDGCGRVRRDAPGSATWVEFFRQVYDPILVELEKSKLISAKCFRQFQRIHQRLDRALPDIDRPRLMHWDLWAMNLLAARNGDGRWHISGVLDPNCKYGHAEAELAYMELFHTATSAFFKAYQRRHKLQLEYHQIRKPIYQLYALANHANLFGHEYAAPLTQAVERVSTLL
jgi:protein-ribulosamine 3-kinase